MSDYQPRLLFIDSYDSFTFNLASLCRQSIPGCVIHIVKNDDFTIQELLPYLKNFSAVIVGPGPGSPDNLHDVGVVKDLWKVDDTHVLPVFGVCLGLQSLGVEFDACLQRLRVVKHGQVSIVQHSSTDLFEGIRPFSAVRYHSLHIVLKDDGELEELAWSNDGEENGRVVMAIRHRTRPFWAVQYHPESVLTNQGGAEVIASFWRLAQEWARTRRTQRRWDPTHDQIFGNPWPTIAPHSLPPVPSLKVVNTIVADVPGLAVIAIAEFFGAIDDTSPFVMLDSAAKPGRYSIVAALMPTSIQIIHNVKDTFITLKQGECLVREELGSNNVWSWLATFMRAHKANGLPESPFWGGFVGQLSYELGVHSLDVGLKSDTDPGCHPDVNLVFVERSVVLDVVANKAYIQSLIPGDDQWLLDTSSQLAKLSSPTPSEPNTPPKPITPPVVTLPDKARYIDRINEAKDNLFSGNSYELCLTVNTHISLRDCSSATPTSWERYKMLRQKNPAPYSAFLRLHPSTFLSSSPERFLSYSRPPHPVCQLRPIKGTIRKAPGITRAVAEELLAGSAKEVAENLMIVDLIRHDLHGVVGDDVHVKQFCAVEEYETVWQLVSVIEGKTESKSGTTCGTDGEIGWEVLRRSLPPGMYQEALKNVNLHGSSGSMTGAPKKRSVEILQNLEDEKRNLYSGVFGYWCVGGGGDWAVAIRSCFKSSHYHHREDINMSSLWTEKWTIGAGGAITALSDAEAEWDEMMVKLQSVLNSFGVSTTQL
ncbi:hypothetical protein C0995_009384 [Termitomyces sp. Mi166|nr:hypothetical protein C0995_009384 [Termitomyces sp. Mi166\